MEGTEDKPLIEVTEFTVEGVDRLGQRGIWLRNISLCVNEGEITVFGGESGSGKSLLCEYISGITRRRFRVMSGTVVVAGEDALKNRSPRPTPRVTFIGRDSVSGFNPRHTVERSLKEFTRLLARMKRKQGIVDWNEAFYAVGIVEPERILPLVIEELPSLMLLRLALMRALLSESEVIVCEEATASLDRVAEGQFIDLVSQIREEKQITFLMAMGRLRNVERFADRLYVFFEGGILESGRAADLAASPAFLYTKEFLGASPRLTHSPHSLSLISAEAIAEAEEILHGNGASLGGDQEGGS